MKIAVVDIVSNSYFPAIAAVELGFFRDEGLEARIERIFPIDKAYEALRDGAADLVAGSAHAALAAFPEWKGVKLLCAQAQRMYWFLVVRADLGATRGEIEVIKGRRIGAAPWVEMGLRAILRASGIDPERDGVAIAPVPAARGGNFGISAADALAEGRIDGFWANGMAAEVAVRGGFGTVVLDVRRGDGPASCGECTMPVIAMTERRIAAAPEAAAAAIRAIVRTQAALKADPALATRVGARLFPPAEAALIEELVRRDLPYYDAAIAQSAAAAMNRFARDMGLLSGEAPYEAVVATPFRALWRPATPADRLVATDAATPARNGGNAT